MNLGYPVLLMLRTMEVVSGDNCSYKTCKPPVKLSPSTYHHHPSVERISIQLSAANSTKDRLGIVTANWLD